MQHRAYVITLSLFAALVGRTRQAAAEDPAAADIDRIIDRREMKLDESLTFTKPLDRRGGCGAAGDYGGRRVTAIASGLKAKLLADLDDPALADERAHVDRYFPAWPKGKAGRCKAQQITVVSAADYAAYFGEGGSVDMLLGTLRNLNTTHAVEIDSDPEAGADFDVWPYYDPTLKSTTKSQSTLDKLPGGYYRFQASKTGFKPCPVVTFTLTKENKIKRLHATLIATTASGESACTALR